MRFFLLTVGATAAVLSSCQQLSQQVVGPIPPPAPETLCRPIPPELQSYYTLPKPPEKR